MANPIITSGFDARLKANVNLFRMAAKEGMEAVGSRQSEQLFNVIDIEGEMVEDFLFRGLGDVPKLEDAETQPLPVADGFELGPVVAYSVEQYGYKFVYTLRAAELDRMGLIRPTVESMGEGAAETIEAVAISFLNEGYTRVGGWDKKPLYAADHQTLSGRTYNNILPPGLASIPALQTLYNYGAVSVRNDEGRPITLGIRRMTVRPELVPAWMKVVLSTTEIGQANPNVPNVFTRGLDGGEALISADRIHGNSRLATFDQHVQFGGHHNNMFFRKRPATRTWNEPDPQAIAVGLDFEVVVGYTDARRNAVMPGMGRAY